MYAELVFPLPFRYTFTYSIPEELRPFAKIGARAVAPFGKRTFTGFIVNVSSKTEVKEEIKTLSDIIDHKPVFDSLALKFYSWISEYYISSLGEALKLAVPYGTNIESKRKIIIDKERCLELYRQEQSKDTLKKKLLEALSARDEINFPYLQKIIFGLESCVSCKKTIIFHFSA